VPVPESDWRPTASLEALRLRAGLLASTRTFFAARGVLEVETPLLASSPASDPHLQALTCRPDAVARGRTLYLQTSPEFAMKRLLAAGSGPIYQVTRAFRDGEAGRRHNPEFTILEWYRPGFDHHALMDEVEALLAATLGTGRGERITYRGAFLLHLGLDPLRAGVDEIRRSARAAGIADVPGLAPDDVDGWLDLLLAAVVEPRLGLSGPTFLLDFPARQAALARVRPDDPPVAERFEVYLRGVELANGYHELTDAVEQRRRCEVDLAERRRRGLPAVPADERALAALEHGLPDCAGVALGFDRLVMLAAGVSDIAEVIAFPIDRA
jgi:elongation factor P--(R)-beta-lysine ligase